MPLKIEGDVIATAKFAFDGEDGGKRYMVQIEDMGVTKKLMVEREFYDSLPETDDLASRSLSDPVKIRLEGALKTKKDVWNPVFTVMVVESSASGSLGRRSRLTADTTS